MIENVQNRAFFCVTQVSNNKNMTTIYIITTKDWWAKWSAFDYYESPTFNEEGFIHLSTESQVSGVLERYFAGQTDLLKLHIKAENLGDALKYEKSTNDELFPHLYARLNKDGVLEVEEID